jgi:hypothetical protein
LWATSNFQQWIKSLQGSLQETVETITTGDTQLLVEEFSHSDTGSTSVSRGAWNPRLDKC